MQTRPYDFIFKHQHGNWKMIWKFMAEDLETERVWEPALSSKTKQLLLLNCYANRSWKLKNMLSTYSPWTNSLNLVNSPVVQQRTRKDFKFRTREVLTATQKRDWRKKNLNNKASNYTASWLEVLIELGTCFNINYAETYGRVGYGK